MPEFTLFRIRSIQESQEDIFKEKPNDVIKSVLHSTDLIELRKRSYWRVGKPVDLGDNSYYFKFGRNIQENKAKFEDGDFMDEQEENARYVHVFLDGELGMVAISKNSSLARTVESIASSLAKYLNRRPVIYERRITFTITSIKDPTDFLKQIRESSAVTMFSFTFKKPNPPDISRFVKAAQEYAKEVNGNGSNTAYGENLNKEVIEEVTNSVASTGDEAKATIYGPFSRLPKRIRLRADNDLIKVIEDVALNMKNEVMESLREVYRKNRNKHVD